ncbi:hypothetical protein CKO51_32010 [Rhodopirellula sp. SM50]|nr:hypothetical protein CKO51_32010 [Rhodopirellula sp. SM50]
MKRRRNGMSLLEVTIGSVMAAMIAMVAAGVTMDMTRNMADNIARTRIAGEARLAIETFRRDFGGNDPDSPTGDRNRWRLVDSMIPTADELRLCFDSDLDGSADWISPDRVILYFESDGQLIRSDLENGRTNVVAQLVDSVNFEVIGNELRITLAFRLGAITETYVFNTPNI